MQSSNRSNIVALLLLALTLALLLMEIGTLPAAGQTTQIVDVTIDSAPEHGPGNYFVFVDNVFIPTPSIYSWHVGETHLLTAAIETRADVDCSIHQCDYWFTSWSDNEPRNHTITVTPSVTTYTAFFVKRAYIFVSGSPAALSDIKVDGAEIANNPQFFGWMPGSTHQLTALNTNGLFTYWSAASFTQIAMNSITYTTPSDGENITANYVADANTTTTQTTTSTVTTPPPNTEEITVTTNPSSQGIISVDGTTIDTPQIYDWQIGSSHYLVAPQTAPGMNCDSCQYDFLYWYASSSREHDSNLFLYTVPSWSETVTAFYQLETTTSTAPITTSTVTVSSTTTSQISTPDFTLSTWPTTLSLPPNTYVGAATFTLTLASISEWNGQVQFATSSLPTGIALANMPTSYQLVSTVSWNVVVNIGTSAPSGSYPLVITAMSGSLDHSAVLTIVVSNQSTAVPEFPLSELGTLATCLISVAVASRRHKTTLKKFSSTRK